MHIPFYYRPPDYRYGLRSAPCYGWWVGVVAGRRQMFRGPTAVVFFDQEGRLLQAEDSRRYPVPSEWCDFPEPPADFSLSWLGEIQFKERPIFVQRFWLPEFWLGIEDMPDILAEFFTAPERFDMEASDVQAWIDTDQYVFHAGCGDFYMNCEGEVETS